MNTIAKFIAPVALVLAAFGAQASEIAPGDLGLRTVVASTASAPLNVVGAPSGERAFAEAHAVSDARASTRVERPAVMAEPLHTTIVIGA